MLEVFISLGHMIHYKVYNGCLSHSWSLSVPVVNIILWIEIPNSKLSARLISFKRLCGFSIGITRCVASIISLWFNWFMDAHPWDPLLKFHSVSVQMILNQIPSIESNIN